MKKKRTNRENRKFILGIVLAFLVMMLVVGLIFIINFTSSTKKNNFLYQKADEFLIGERIEIEREGQKSINGNIYLSDNESKKVPLIINIHGGAFIGGDADSLDTQSDRISKNNNAVVFTINYTLLEPYRMLLFPRSKIDYQIDEIVHSIKYFKYNADTYNIDTDKIIIMGYSAGGHLALGATNKLAAQGECIFAQILGYGYLKNGMEQYKEIPDEYKKLCNTLIIFTNKDDFISESMREYYNLLERHSVPVTKLEYPNVNHGFLEENNPEYEKLSDLPGRSEEQEKYMIDAENKIVEWISNLE